MDSHPKKTPDLSFDGDWHYQILESAALKYDVLQLDNSVTFVKGVCLRPVMYTIHGTLEEIGAFLEGFYSGMTSHSRDKAAIAAARHYWFDFCEWATAKLFGYETTWTNLFIAIKKSHQTESEGFAKLIELYEEYLVVSA